MENQVLIAPSLLAADPLSLGQEVKAAEQAGADWLHLDIMDGHFVPNLSYGPAMVQAVRKASHLPLDVHLMIAPVDGLIPAFAEAGANIITIHPEAGPHLHRSISLIKSLGCKAGVALNPATALELVQPVLEDIDLVLVMSVNPGFGGQSFIEGSLARLEQMRQMIDHSTARTGRTIHLQVDGGINPSTAAKVVKAGANVLVAGSAIFGAPNHDYRSAIQHLRGI